MNENNTLQFVRNVWSKQNGDSSDFLHYLTDHQEIPESIPGKPYISDYSKNYFTLNWPQVKNIHNIPIVYLVEASLVTEDKETNWINLGMSQTNSLDIYNLKGGQKYKFKVTPRNQFGWGETVISGAIEIEMFSQFPEFEKYLPVQIKVLKGTSVTLECQVKNDTETKVQWYQNEILIEENHSREISFQNRRCILKLTNLNENDSGRYVCEAFNRHGKVCTFVTVAVEDNFDTIMNDKKIRLKATYENKIDLAPEFVMRLRNKRVEMTYPVRLTCQITGYPKPKISWFKDEDIIKENKYYSIYEDEEGFHSLEINHSLLEHSGTYIVTATNNSGTVTCRCNVTVDNGIRNYIIPKFISEFQRNYKIPENSELRIRAVIQAYPTVEIAWMKNGTYLRPSRKIIMTLNHDGVIELTIAQIKLQDSGTYTCIASNDLGSAETSTKIEIFQRIDYNLTSAPDTKLSDHLYSKEPKFLIKPCSCTALENDHVVIKCQVIGDPKPDILWLRNRLKLLKFELEHGISQTKHIGFNINLHIAT